MTPTVVPTGESAITVVFGVSVDLALNDRVLALDASMRSDPIAGVVESVPAPSSLLVRFDPGAVRREAVTEAVLSRTTEESSPHTTSRRWRIPAMYGGEHGPDLGDVAAILGLSEEATIEAHASLELRVLMLGFAPGFAYLGVAGAEWDLDRRATVRARVPAGSVLVAARQSALSGTAVPTGWHQIAHSPIATFQPTADEPFLLAPGDMVTFEPLSLGDYQSLRARVGAGNYAIRPESVG